MADSRNYKSVGEYTTWQELEPQLDPGDLVELDRGPIRVRKQKSDFRKQDDLLLLSLELGGEAVGVCIGPAPHLLATCC